MNFFSHYYFYKKVNDPWYNAGLLFPDLLRNFTSSNRITQKKNLIIDVSNPLQLSLMEGISKHFHSDKVFHNWDWFIENNELLAMEIRNSGLNIKRDYFLAHIFIELAIDHVLVKKNEADVEDLYHQLKLCELDEWRRLFVYNHFNEIEQWINNLSNFIKHHYIMTYKYTDKISYALSRIYLSTGIGELDAHQCQFLENLLNTFVPQVESKISELRKILE